MSSWLMLSSPDAQSRVQSSKVGVMELSKDRKERELLLSEVLIQAIVLYVFRIKVFKHPVYPYLTFYFLIRLTCWQ